MELRHLERFLAVAKTENFTKAAKTLHIEQSPLSRSIQDLEADLRLHLFARNNGKTRLTPAGMAYQREVTRVFKALERAQYCAEVAQAGRDHVLWIALYDGISPSWLAGLMAHLREVEPTIALRLVETDPDEFVRDLVDEDVDIVFSCTPVSAPGLSSFVAWSEPLHVAMPERHPLLEHATVPLEAVLAYPVVVNEAPSGAAGLEFWLEFGLGSGLLPGLSTQIPESAMPLDRVKSFDAMMILVAAGHGLAIAGASQIAARKKFGVVSRPLQGAHVPAITYAIRRDPEPSALTASLITRIESWFKSCDDEAPDSSISSGAAHRL